MPSYPTCEGMSPGRAASTACADTLPDMASSPFTAAPGKTTAVAPSQLSLFHRNPRKGDVSAIMASLRRHNQYKPITANIGTHTGRAHEVLAGNHTLLAFRELAEAEPDDPRWRKIVVFWVDVDEDMAERIVVADNQTSQLGGFDTEQLVALIEKFGEDTEGLGFTDTDIKSLMELHEGPPDLDDLAEEHGDPQPNDAFDGIKLKVDPVVAQRWNDWRASFDSDTAALAELLDQMEADDPEASAQ
ncbi:ParB-like partition protein [Mycobacterium phage Saguaro]|uniref:ParB-like nuclease domain protein n=1 Tax=Mycobacterium phage Saguaro TaxID=2315616 RepID=A0A386KCK5_9CAUD|nr:ParB-like partition protein [Mycobacterium phage Saguaro]AYD81996.1 ParB-like nuclease domain protein [Mycobacterium phage Saguaro]